MNDLFLKIKFVFVLVFISSCSRTEICEGKLSSILVNGDTIEFFNSLKKEYILNVPYNFELENINVTPLSDNGELISIKYPINLYSDSAILRTAQINIGATVYSIEFNILPELDLFLCLGQSNMEGWAHLLPEDSEPIPNVYLLTPQGSMEFATNPLNKYSNNLKEAHIPYIGLGPSYSFSQKIVQLTHRKIGLIVNARGGSKLEEWIKGGKLYDNTLIRVHQVQKYGTFKGILWHQGEYNAWYNLEWYKEVLSNIVSDLRKDINSPSLYFVMGELPPWYSELHQDFNRNVVKTIKEYIPYSSYISAEGTAPNDLEDYIHFDNVSQKILGKRYADTIYHYVYNSEYERY